LRNGDETLLKSRSPQSRDIVQLPEIARSTMVQPIKNPAPRPANPTAAAAPRSGAQRSQQRPHLVERPAAQQRPDPERPLGREKRAEVVRKPTYLINFGGPKGTGAFIDIPGKFDPGHAALQGLSFGLGGLPRARFGGSILKPKLKSSPAPTPTQRTAGGATPTSQKAAQGSRPAHVSGAGSRVEGHPGAQGRSRAPDTSAKLAAARAPAATTAAPDDRIRMASGASHIPLSVKAEDGSWRDVRNTYTLEGDAKLHSFRGGLLAYDDGSAAPPRLLAPTADAAGLPRTREPSPSIYRNPARSSNDSSSHLAVLSDGTLQRLRQNSVHSREFVDVRPAVRHDDPAGPGAAPQQQRVGGEAAQRPFAAAPPNHGLKGGAPTKDAAPVRTGMHEERLNVFGRHLNLSKEAYDNLSKMESTRHFAGVMNVGNRRIDLAISNQLGNPGSDIEKALPKGTLYRVGKNGPDHPFPIDALHTAAQNVEKTGHALMVDMLGGRPDDYVGFSGIKRSDDVVRLKWASRTLNPQHADFLVKHHMINPGERGRDYMLAPQYRAMVIEQFRRAGFQVVAD